MAAVGRRHPSPALYWFENLTTTYKMTTTITYGSVCSGIEAVSVAVRPLGWEAVWLAEIEPHPAMVLHHHYGSGRPLHMPDPDERDLDEEDRKDRRAAIRAVAWLPAKIDGPRNLGDFTRIANMVRNGLVAAPDVLVGGTPCQAFSIAGLRAGLSDARGALTLAFVELANAIDATRSVRGIDPAVIWWENVPGVLSSKDNAFGCFLGALAGEDCELVSPRGKWPNAGVVFGPQRTVAWRVTDAQYFGVAQRRRRVFVVASAREGFDPAEVLFEFDGLRRDTAPSRETGQDVTGTISSRTTGGGGLGTDFECAGGLQPVTVMAHGQGGAEISFDRSPTLTCNHEAPIAAYSTSGAGYWREGIGALRARPQDSHENLAIAFDSRQDCVSSTEVFGALGSSSPQAQAVSYAIQAGALRTNPNSGPDGVGVQEHIAYTLVPTKKITRARAEAILAAGDPAVLIGDQWWKQSVDGPRYKALGNSMCVFNMRWIGARIDQRLRALSVSNSIPFIKKATA